LQSHDFFPDLPSLLVIGIQLCQLSLLHGTRAYRAAEKGEKMHHKSTFIEPFGAGEQLGCIRK
jgi:hypothetical protein